MAVVLVVDDDDDIRDIIAFRVRRDGHEVTSIGHPSQALDVAAGQTFDLAILDWSMPVMNGGELCEKLHALPHLDGLPVLIVTAYADMDTRQSAERSGASSYLTKPFSLHDLAGCVGALLPVVERAS